MQSSSLDMQKREKKDNKSQDIDNREGEREQANRDIKKLRIYKY